MLVKLQFCVNLLKIGNKSSKYPTFAFEQKITL